MDRRYLSSHELLNASTSHAYCADYLLQSFNRMQTSKLSKTDMMLSVISLMYHAMQLLLKAYSLHTNRSTKEHKSLAELLELNGYLALSSQEIALTKNLARQYAFHKGIDYELWDDEQQLHVFCEKILSLYERMQQMMPLELQPDYLG